MCNATRKGVQLCVIWKYGLRILGLTSLLWPPHAELQLVRRFQEGAAIWCQVGKGWSADLFEREHDCRTEHPAYSRTTRWIRKVSSVRRLDRVVSTKSQNEDVAYMYIVVLAWRWRFRAEVLPAVCGAFPLAPHLEWVQRSGFQSTR